ncbi:ABC transporter substrate-binding protein [Amorphoplanes digitatis]|uniref:NitT/TauT family transport system substrate-binding protein n=1 Tax=Actinoplanes digitatis TaxID=1868 RepID=A0A7W7I042_9ACTN|nr:ABC transporter substrate-binding protein [Actinoplanes digitatis]MBB4763893.1 NitT/TauT family transport system substrate-binding protein [Actinoplanes digitatis]GID93712.1 nitrate ABC transporter substrate-binding protein [Actinoplanes digitatis]
MSRTQSRRIQALALAVTAVLLAGACGTDDNGSTSASGNTKVKIGVIPIVDVAPIYLGLKQGFFTAEGLDVTLETAQGGAAIVPGVVSGQYQFGFSNTTSLLLAESKGLPLKVVSSGVASTGAPGKDFGAVVVKDGSPIKTAADLAGKRVAVNTLKNINTTTINKVVRDAGADPSTIKYVELAFPDIVPAIAKGDVDAGQLVEPFLTIATGQGDRQVVSNYAGTDPDLTVAMYFTSQDYAKKDPEAVAGFTAAMARSMEYATSHPDEARAALNTYTKIDRKVQQELILPRWPAAIDRDSVQLLADLAKQDGLITEQPDLETLLP